MLLPHIHLIILIFTCSLVGSGILFYIFISMFRSHAAPRAVSGVVRIDPLRFLARCRKKRLNQALPVLSLSLGFFWLCVVLLTRDSFYVVLFLLFVCSVAWLFLLGCQYQCKWLTGKTLYEMTYNMLMGTLNPSLSLIHSLTHSLPTISLIWTDLPSVLSFPNPSFRGRVSWSILPHSQLSWPCHPPIAITRDVRNRFFNFCLVSVRFLKKLWFSSEWIWFGSVCKHSVQFG